MATFSNFVNDPHLNDFSIELDKKDSCYNPGDLIVGKVVLRSKQDIEVGSLKFIFFGAAKFKTKNKSNENYGIYLNNQMESITETQKVEAEKTINVQFEQKLPNNAVTSLESKNASVLYIVKAQMRFKTEENVTRIVTSLKGLTVVEKFDLNVLSRQYFEPPNYNLTKKFGLFSCTGGHIKLTFTVCRSAFVCGENISIEGRIENKTDRRVDKVAAVLQQVIIVTGSGVDGEESETSILDVSDIHEDNLALFVDEGHSIRIQRNFAIPALPPSTMITDYSTVESGDIAFLSMTKKKRLSLSATRPSISSGNSKPSSDLQRLFKIMYQLSVKVKTGGVEVMEINVPIIIGSLPYELVLPRTLSQMSEKEKAKINTPLLPDEKIVIYRQSRKDRPVQLACEGEHYMCNRTQLNFVNKYPLYADLPTSSKQSRKVNILANTIKAEAGFIHGVRQVDGSDSISFSSEQTFTLPNSVTDY
uniref:Arrestin C-terminal-like domain-containing protein n=1 Tax=Panagrolaimus sp. JU765 TaxID=591449 RepID=A0AC34Q5E8_9BILA